MSQVFCKIIPIRFILFSIVGLSGVFVHMLLLTALFKYFHFSFIIAQTIATYIAMTSNYFINNYYTYRINRLYGKKLFIGLISFYLICSIGALINIESANLIFKNEIHWAIAGVAGTFIGAIWNYALSSTFTWKTVQNK